MEKGLLMKVRMVIRYSAPIVSFLGALLTAISVIPNPNHWVYNVEQTKKFLGAVVDVELFKWGLILMACGFFLQVVKTFLDEY